MAVSLPFCPNISRYLLVDLVNEPLPRDHQPICLLAQRIPTSAADRTPDSSRPTKDMS